MSQEERGNNEEYVDTPSSAELSPSESAAPSNGQNQEIEPESNEPVAESQTEAVVDDATEMIDNSNDEAESVHPVHPVEESARQTETDVPEETGDTETETTEAEAVHPVEESAQAAAPEVAEVEDESGLKRGEIYDGVISRTTPTAVYVEFEGNEGVVPGRELEMMGRKMLESLKVGAEILVYVVNPNNHRGEIVLSINHAIEEMDWRKAKEYAKSKEAYTAKIGGYNRGGLIVRFGRLRGFVPQSQIAASRIRQMQGETPEERYGGMVNETIDVKVMEVDRSRNRLILSERAAMREVRQRRKEELIGDLKVGEVRTGHSCQPRKLRRIC